MNEASSKYVDQIAVEKLLTEKLNNVHHYCNEAVSGNEVDLKNIENINVKSINFQKKTNSGKTEILFNSIVQSGINENDNVCCLLYETHEDYITGDLIFIHGLYEENLQIYNYFISSLNEKGINVYLMMLPYHYERRPANSLFSGEFFWSGDINRNVLAFKQSIFDLYSIYLIVKRQSKKKVIISGFSMGGGIALTLASLINLDGIFAINPISNITSLIWNSKLFSPVKNDFEVSGLDYEKVKKRFEEFEPLERDSLSTNVNRIGIGLSLYDQINDPQNYELLIKKWSMKNVFRYKAGHLNVFRVPKLTNNIGHLFFPENK